MKLAEAIQTPIISGFSDFRLGFPAVNHETLSGSFGVRFQPVNATHWLNRSAGVSKFNVLLGRSFKGLATAFSLACVTSDRSIPFGKYCLNRPLVFSLEPLYQGSSGSQKGFDNLRINQPDWQYESNQIPASLISFSDQSLLSPSCCNSGVAMVQAANTGKCNYSSLPGLVGFGKRRKAT